MALNAVLEQRIDVAPGLVVFRVAPHGFDLPDFLPGQFAVLGMPRAAERCAGADQEDPAGLNGEALIQRAYSIASSSVAKEFLELYISLVPSGQLTPRLFALRPGDALWLGPKITGLFTLDRVQPHKHVVFIGTGTGLAPYMSMLRTHLVCGGERRFAVLHGARRSWDLGYRSELMGLTRMCSNFTYLPIVSRPDPEDGGWAGPSGYVQSLWVDRVLEKAWGFAPTPEDTDIFLCGAPAMIEDMLVVLATEGFREHRSRQPGEVHAERYW